MRLKVSVTLLATVLLVCFTFESDGIARATFKEDQMRYERVRTAYQEKESITIFFYQ